MCLSAALSKCPVLGPLQNKHSAKSTFSYIKTCLKQIKQIILFYLEHFIGVTKLKPEITCNDQDLSRTIMQQ